MAGLAGAGAVAGGAALAAFGPAAPASADPAVDKRPFVAKDVMPINVKDFGAEGDDETDDTDAIEAAIEAAGDADASVYFPPGTYRVSRTLYPRARQRLVGSMPNAILKSVDGVPAFTMFSTEQALDGAVTFEGLAIDLNRANTTAPDHSPEENAFGAHVGTGIYFLGTGAGSADNRVDSCEVRNGWQVGIVLQRPDDVPELGLDIERTTVRECSAGIVLYQASRARVINSTVTDNAREGSTSSNGLVIVHCADALVQGLTSFRNGRHGILVKNSWNFRILGCTSSENGTLPGSNKPHYGWGITVGRSRNLNFDEHDNSTDFVIAGNRCDNNWVGGITLDPTKHEENWRPQETRAVLTGNSCTDSESRGIHGIQLNRVRGATVTGNSCHGMPNTGIYVGLSSHCVIVGNALSDNGNRGINLNALDGPEPYGHHLVGPNHYSGNQENLRIAPTNQVSVQVLEPEEMLALDAAEVGFFGADPVARSSPYDVVGTTGRRDLDVNSAGVHEVADVLSTLLEDLRRLGLVG